MEDIKLAVDYGALGILFFMSILVLAYTIEQLLFYNPLHVRKEYHSIMDSTLLRPLALAW